jgi:mannose-6-phosphate isomerase
MHGVTGAVQHYPWGDTKAIPVLLGRRPDGRPWAEWWLGTHQMAPSTLNDGTPLRDLAGELPFLLKLLAAAEPLSLQVHPTKQQAELGFARESAAGVPLNSPHRIFRDPNPKPELLCAITRFDALCGVRTDADAVGLLRRVQAWDLAEEVTGMGVTATIEHLYRRNIDPYPTIAACADRPDPEARLAAALAAQYPDDPSVVVTLLLNRVALQPGEAIFLGPGQLHAYLHGVGVEVMGASDNVVRGGLTTKHVDVPQLLDIADLRPRLPDVINAVEPAPGVFRYDTPKAPFRLWRYEIDGPLTHKAASRELWMCLKGSLAGLTRGSAVFLAAGDRLEGTGRASLVRVEER